MIISAPCTHKSNTGVNCGPEYSTRSAFSFIFFFILRTVKTIGLNVESSTRLPTGGKQISVPDADTNAAMETHWSPV